MTTEPNKDMRERLQRVSRARMLAGRMRELLERHGAEDVSELPPEVQAEYMALRREIEPPADGVVATIVRPDYAGAAGVLQALLRDENPQVPDDQIGAVAAGLARIAVELGLAAYRRDELVERLALIAAAADFDDTTEEIG